MLMTSHAELYTRRCSASAANILQSGLDNMYMALRRSLMA